MKKTLVLGSSENPERYSYLATSRLRAHEHPVVGVGLKPGKIGDSLIQTEFPSEHDIDTVTLYMSAKNQEPYLNQIIDLEPKRIIFNPGTENPVLEQMAEAKGIETVHGCTLVMLSTGQY